MKLSIIIPYYNAEPYTSELLEVLAPQVTNEVEVIVVDDGSREPFKTDYKWCKVIRQDNGGVSKARNVGIEKSSGEYISFIDADDLVSDDYVEQIIKKMPFDYLDMSWRTFKGKGLQAQQKLNSQSDRLPNPSACTRAFSRAFIGDHRFNERKDSAEDEDFTRHLFYGRDAKVAVITDFAYFYRTYVNNSKTKKYVSGRTKTKRIVYNLPKITKDMTYLIDEFRKEDEVNEVYLMTKYNELPELAEYAQIMPPQSVRGMELRGEPTNLFTLIETPYVTQVAIYAKELDQVNGRTTFVYNFCRFMKDYYDIAVFYESGDMSAVRKLRNIVDTRKIGSRIISCDTLIVNSIHDDVPFVFVYEQRIQMVHACKTNKSWKIPESDRTVFVSYTAMESWGIKGETFIHNMIAPADDKPLILVSATRVSDEKGQHRIVEFGRLLKSKGVKYQWLLFTDLPIKGMTEDMVQMPIVSDITAFIKSADYVVHLSDIEAWSYVIIESLVNNTPVITTPITMLTELAFEPGKNGYVIPFDVNDTTDNMIDEIVHKIPKFTFKYDNDTSVNMWRDILGNTTPKKTYTPEQDVTVRILAEYDDIELQKHMIVNEFVKMPISRAEYLQNEHRFVEIID